MYEGMNVDQIIEQMRRNGFTQEGVNLVYQLRGLGTAPTLPAEGIRTGQGRAGAFMYDANGKQIKPHDAAGVAARNFFNDFGKHAIDPYREYTVGNYLGMAGLLAGGAGALSSIAAANAAAGAAGAGAGAGAGGAGAAGGAAAGGAAGAGGGTSLGIFANGGAGGLAGVGGGSAGALAASGGIAGGAGIGGTTAGALGGLSGVANSISGVGGSAAAGGTKMGWLDTLLDVGPDLLGAYLSHDAAGDAADLQREGSKEAIAETRRQYDQDRADLAPFREAGTTAIGQLGAGTAAGGDFNRDFTMADFQKDPGYEFRMAEGSRALEGSAAARGGLLSGGTGRALERYGQDYASGEFSSAYSRFNNDRNTRFNRLASIAGVGQTATNTGVAAGNNASGNVIDSIIGGANAAAAGRVGEANAINGGIETLGDYYRNRRYGGYPRGSV